MPSNFLYPIALTNHLEGFDKVWKEVIYKGQIWLGYKDVPLEIQAKFDKSLTKSLPKAQKK